MSDALSLEAQPQDTMRLRWGPSEDGWVAATPVGNGRIGAMVLGGAPESRIQINDATAWSGTPAGPAAALDELVAAGAGPGRLAEVRAAIDAGSYRRAEQLLYTFEGSHSQEFLPFADLRMSLTQPPAHPDAAPAPDPVPNRTAYERELDLDRGVVTERFVVNGTEVTRTTWASRVSGALVVHLSADRPFDLTLTLTTPLARHRSTHTENGIALGLHLPADGAPLHEEVAEPHRYAAPDSSGFDPYGAVAMSVHSDGTVTAGNQALRVVSATRVLVAVCTDTNAAAWWDGADADTLDPSRRSELVDGVLNRSAKVATRQASELLAEHVADLGPLLAATMVRIGPRRTGSFDVASDVLRGGDETLTATVMLQLGRYLLASASRPGGPPANLQGIWNDDPRPPWSSNYTININTQMNYWAAESAGLSECHLPLIDLVERLSVAGAPAARRLYGARGWVAHHNTDLWTWPLPVGAGHGDPAWAIWMMGGLWLTDHVWQHWAFTLDEDFLRDRAWPILIGAAQFTLDWLVEDKAGGLRTIPSTSPENLFRGPDGHPESLGVSTAMDLSFIRALFLRVKDAADLLDIDSPVLAEIDAALPRLPGLGTTPDGRLREWGLDVEEVDPCHRHMSPMVAVYPLALVTPERTPELARAALATLDGRGPGAMGWSWAWKIALRARLGDAETAAELLREATMPLELDHTRPAPVDGSQWGGLLPNLFSTHPPFQIDGNYGFTAAILEMLISGRDGVVHLLPALPRAWAEGEITGARVPGGFAVDLRWRQGALESVRVKRVADHAARDVVLTWGQRRWTLRLEESSPAELDLTVPTGLREST